MSAHIEVRGLGVRFDLDRQRRPVTPGMRRVRGRCTMRWGMRGLDLTLEAGRSVALIGPNGAGKTTLLRVLAGILPADEGSVAVRGRVASLLAVEGGLMTALTGRENALLLGTLAGLPRAEAAAADCEVELASNLGEAYDRPVATYSQGMRARLGLAVLERTQPEILLLDEVHEALDEGFRGRLREVAARIAEAGGIVVAAGHDHAELRQLCTEVLLLEPGGLRLGAWGELDEAERVDWR